MSDDRSGSAEWFAAHDDQADERLGGVVWGELGFGEAFGALGGEEAAAAEGVAGGVDEAFEGDGDGLADRESFEPGGVSAVEPERGGWERLCGGVGEGDLRAVADDLDVEGSGGLACGGVGGAFGDVGGPRAAAGDS